MTDRLIIPEITQKKFIFRLKGRALEDTDAVGVIEAYLQKKRGYVFTMPKPGMPVILLISGGIDSTVAWYLLTSVYNLHVYPLFITSSRVSMQGRSVSYFSHLYKKLLGDSFHAPLIMYRDFFPKELADIKHPNELPEATLLDMYSMGMHGTEMKNFAGLNGMSAQFGTLYSIYLKTKYRITADTMFCGVTARDGVAIRSQTLTSLRATLLSLIYFHGLPKLQYASIFFEKETGWYAQKRDIIALGTAAGLPMEKTYSCYTASIVHCGECRGCHTRQYEFKKARVKDPTIYWLQVKMNIAKYISPVTIKKSIKSVIKTILFARRGGGINVNKKTEKAVQKTTGLKG